MKSVFSLFFAIAVLSGSLLFTGCFTVKNHTVYYDKDGNPITIPERGMDDEQVEEGVDLRNYVKRSNNTKIITVTDTEGRQIIQNEDKELLFYLVNNTRFAMNCYVYGSDGKLLKKIWVNKNETFPAWFLRDKKQQLKVRWEMEEMPEKFQEDYEPFFNNAADCHYKSPSHGYSTCHID